MNNRMDRNQISFSTFEDLEKEDRDYWATTSIEERLCTVTYLRECLYGPKATTGRLQRVYQFLKLQ